MIKQKEDVMVDFKMNHAELSQYSVLRAQVIELDEKISAVEEELAELNKYNINISPVLTGMPSGNEKLDKIGDFVITLENDRQRLNTALEIMTAERTALKYKMYKIVAAVNKIPNQQLQDIIKLHYIEGLSIIEIADKNYMTEYGIYKKLDKFLGARRKKRSK